MPSLVVAPFSNSAIRDWPVSHFERLLDGLLSTSEVRLTLVGAKEQQPQIEALRGRLAPEVANKVTVNVGSPLPEVAKIIQGADLVISNNSGIGHLAAMMGRPVLVIFSASHDIETWMPRGVDVTVLSVDISCKECHLDHNNHCPNGHRCMVELPVERVAAIARARLLPRTKPVGGCGGR